MNFALQIGELIWEKEFKFSALINLKVVKGTNK